MKKTITFLTLVLINLLLMACTNNYLLEVTIDFNSNTVTSITDDLQNYLNITDDAYELIIELNDLSVTYDLKVNNKKVSSKDIKKVDNTLVYIFDLSDYETSRTKTTLKLNSDGGIYDASIFDYLNPTYTFNINYLNDTKTKEFVVFTNQTEGLLWYYKMLLKFSEKLNAYEVIYADQYDKSLEKIDIKDYDLIIASHYHNELFNNEDLKKLFTNDYVGSIIDFNLDSLEEFTSVEINYYQSNLTADEFSVEVESEFSLPTPIKDGFEFIGWHNGTTYVETFKVSDYDTKYNVITLYAHYSGLSIQSLENHLNTLIPNVISNSILLPLTFSDYNLAYTSSNTDVLTNDGLFNTSFSDSTITLTIDITKADGFKKTLKITREVMRMRDLSSAFTSSYIYRAFNALPDSAFTTLDMMNAAFIDTDIYGNLTGTAFLANVDNHIMPRARKNGNWVILTIGPASDPSIWSKLAQSQETINNFANNIVEVINKHGFHGVDIDWETPSVSEKANFTKLIKTVYEKVKENNPNHKVSAAITGGQWQPRGYDLENSNKYLDYINVMTYGMSNNGGRYQNPLYAATTYHNQQLQLGGSVASASIHESVGIFNSYGVSKNKLVIGLAFYGIRQTRTFNSTNNTWSSFTNAGSVFYPDILNGYLKNSNYVEVYDQRAGVPYIYKLDGTEFISYDNPTSIKEKSAYVIKQGLAGVMFWEYGTDTSNTLLNALKEAFRH